MSSAGREIPALVDHLFRHEAGKMVAALVRIFGLENLELAEDVVQETLCRALEAWKFNRLPENPAAFLMRAARNRALDVIRRDRNFRKFAPDLTYQLETEWTLASTVDGFFLEKEIQDGQLRMMFSCCHPKLSREAQTILILKILCGFSVSEIAGAFLMTEAAVEKSLSRAKSVLKSSGVLFDVAGEGAIHKRIDAVLHALYLLFNEGYHSANAERAVREDLIEEALRLGVLLAEHPIGGVPATHAVVALMCLHAARLPSRVDDEGFLVLLEAQDRSKWDRALIERGLAHLYRSSVGPELTAYHLEAAIAAEHCLAERFDTTDWKTILALYEVLAELAPSPIVALNRAIVVGQVEGPERGLEELERLPNKARLEHYLFFATALGELERKAGRLDRAREHFERARALAKSRAEIRFVESKLAECAP